MDNQQTWTVIRKNDDEYDAIPNNWITSPNMALYPDKGTATVTKMAKNGTPTESDWVKVPITIIKENYASFDRCMKDAIRFDRGVRSISASETEERGAGRRTSRVRKRSTSIDSDSVEEYPHPPPRKSPRYKRQLTIVPVEVRPSSVPSTSATAQPEAQPSTSKYTQATPPKGCSISKKKHFCSLQNTVTLESLARGLCELSKAVHGLQAKLKDLREEVNSKKADQSSGPNIEDTGLETEDETYALPLQTMDDVNAFEHKLKDKQLHLKILQQLLQNVEKTNVSKTARSAIKHILATSVAQKFSWKGQQRRDQAESKECFSTLQINTLIYKCVKTIWPNENDLKRKIEATLSTYLSQQGSILKRASTTTTDKNKEEGGLEK